MAADIDAEPEGLTVGDRLSCGCAVQLRDVPCGWHKVSPGYATPRCGRCEFGVVGMWHRIGCPGPATTQGDQES
jgi:hypothetical protein